jgi:hypothetical protein
MTYAIHPVIPTRSDPCRGLNIPIVDIKINVFRDRLSGFGLMSDTPVIKRQITKETGITNNNGSRSTPDADMSESLGRNLLQKPRKNP